MADLSQRTYTFELSFGGEQIEHVPGGMVVHGARMQWRKREYRHTNPTKTHPSPPVRGRVTLDTLRRRKKAQ